MKSILFQKQWFPYYLIVFFCFLHFVKKPYHFILSVVVVFAVEFGTFRMCNEIPMFNVQTSTKMKKV